MGKRTAAVLLLAGCLPALAQVEYCAGSVGVATFRLSAAAEAGGSPVWVPLRRLNHLPRGHRVRYQPGTLPADLDKDAAMTLVMVPASAAGEVTVLQPGPVTTVSEWLTPFDAGVVLFVFAPQGLDPKRLTNLVTQDESLISALAEYADQTAELEATLATLSQIEDEEETLLEARVSTPTEQALLSLVRALNPAVSSYDPLSAGRRAGPTSMMGRGANVFFENAGGIVPGGGILPSVKGWLMPDTEFRSVFGSSHENGDMTLCAQRLPRGRNKIAYVWAYQLTNAAPPMASVAQGSANIADVPMDLRAGVSLRVGRVGEWDLLARVFDWSLVPENGTAPLRVSARIMPDLRQLRLDLRGFSGPPGLYRMEGRWDWDRYSVAGSVRLHKLDDLSAATLTPESRDRFVTETGLVALELVGANLRFVDRVAMQRAGNIREIRVDLPAERTGAADRLRLEVDTDGLRPGPYVLKLARVDGAEAELPLELLPKPPVLESGAVRLHIGESEQTVTLRGSGLDRLERLESDGAEIELLAPGEDPTRRPARVRLRSGTQAGTRLNVAAQVQGMAALLRFPAVFQVAGARPRITESRPSIPEGLAVAPQSGELPAGSFVSFAIRIEPADPKPVLTLACADPARTVSEMRLMAGEKRDNAQLTPAGPGQLFLSLDPGVVGQSGCSLTATVGSEELGVSGAFTLGKVVRLPRIASFAMTNESAPGGFAGQIQGWELETIERTGWDAAVGLDVADLPRPIAGESAKQSLKIIMPWPSPLPKAPLYVWLRGETTGRATTTTQ